LEFWDFPESSIYIKVDRHVLRICLGSGVFDDYSHAIIENPSSSDIKSLQGTADKLIARGFFTRQQYESKDIEVIMGKPLLDKLSEEFREYTMRTGMSAVDLDDALWGVGSKTCSLNDHSYCRTACEIKCGNRPFSDDHANYLFSKLDKRNGSEGLLFG